MEPPREAGKTQRWIVRFLHPFPRAQDWDRTLAGVVRGADEPARVPEDVQRVNGAFGARFRLLRHAGSGTGKR
jgi:hypothetical protein